MSCIFYASSLINNLSDVVLWNWTGLPVGNWLADIMRDNFANVLTYCFEVLPSV